MRFYKSAANTGVHIGKRWSEGGSLLASATFLNESASGWQSVTFAQPVQIQQAELSAAMATGVIESYMSSGSTGYDTKTYEHIKNFYDTQAWIPKNAILVNARAFDALDAPTKAAVVKAAADAEARGWKVAEEKNAEYKRLLAERGMKIHKPSAKLDADMRQVGGIMQADWLKAAGADGAAIIDAYKKN